MKCSALLFAALFAAAPAFAVEPMVSPLHPPPPPMSDQDMSPPRTSDGTGDDADPTARIGQWCQQVGLGAAKMAVVRDGGTARDGAVSVATNGKPVPDQLRGQFEAMADLAYRYPDLSPNSIKMMGFSACMMSQVGMLSPEAMSRLEKVIRGCRPSKTTSEEDFEHCTDEKFASLIDARVHEIEKDEPAPAAH